MKGPDVQLTDRLALTIREAAAAGMSGTPNPPDGSMRLELEQGELRRGIDPGLSGHGAAHLGADGALVRSCRGRPDVSDDACQRALVEAALRIGTERAASPASLRASA